MIKNSHPDLLVNPCPTPTAEGSWLHCTDIHLIHHWKSTVAEGPEGAELNRIITEQTLSTHSMVQKTDWFVWSLLDYLTDGSDNKSLYNTTAALVYYCIHVLDVLKIFKAAFSNILSPYYNSLISWYKMASLSSEWFNLNKSKSTFIMSSTWHVALQDFKALTGISELSFQFYHGFVQPSLFRWWLAAPLSAMCHAAQVENSQVVLGLGREGESSSQPNLSFPTVGLPLVEHIRVLLTW